MESDTYMIIGNKGHRYNRRINVFREQHLLGSWQSFYSESEGAYLIIIKETDLLLAFHLCYGVVVSVVLFYLLTNIVKLLFPGTVGEKTVVYPIVPQCLL